MPNNKMLIDAAHPEETRVVMVRGNRVDEFDFESEHKNQLRGNIYLAKVTRVEPSLQAAFVDYGGNRHGFLAFSEIHPDYYQIPIADRQALLEAEAEDARLAAEDEARALGDTNGEPANADEDGEDSEETKKPTRKRRSRRASKKKADAKADADDSDDSDGESDAEVVADDADVKPTPDDVQEEESDNDAEMQAADNENDDVVSEPAASETPEKPKRRTARRKKKTDEEGADAAAEASKKGKAEETTEAEEPAKPKRRTRSKKKDTAAEADDASKKADAETEADADNEEKPKRKRRTSRKKDAKADTVAEDTPANDGNTDTATDTDTAVEAKSGDEPAEEEKSKPAAARKTRSRSKSKRRKSEDAPEDDGEEDSENESVEAVGAADALEEIEVPVRRVNRRQYKIQEVIKRRQILLVQVVKEERGNKGAALTTYLSLAGRYSVLMPNTARGGGISRKITNSTDRKRLKGIASKLEVPQGMGVILRTAGASRSAEEIQRDFEYLMRLWENVRTLTLESTAPTLVYEEGNLIKRSIRDLYDKDTGEVLVAGENGHREAHDFMSMMMPDHAKNVKLYRDRVPMFTRMGVETQLDAMLQPQVTLKSGGYIIIDQTEALVAIDVNSGRSTRQHSVEDTATQTNLEAADEVARQLRLRDLAGLIVIDFIDMEDRRHIRAVEKRLKDALKNDRARIQVGRISHFGLMEMSRQRIRASVLESTTQVCPTCDGLGHVRSASSVALSVLRAVEDHLNRNSRNNLTVKVSTQTAMYLLNTKRESLSDLETRFGVTLTIEADNTLGLQPCAIERGSASNRPASADTAVQPDTISMDSMDDSDESAVLEGEQEPSAGTGEASDDDGGQKRRRRRRRRRGGSKSPEGDEVQASEQAAEDTTDEPVAAGDENASEEASDDKPDKAKRSTRSRRKKAAPEPDTEQDANVAEGLEDSKAGQKAKDGDDEPAPSARRTSRPRRSRKDAKQEETGETSKETAEAASPPESTTNGAQEPDSEPDKPARPARRTTRRRADTATETATNGAEPDSAESVSAEAAATEQSTEEKPRRGGWWQRRFF